MRPCSAPRASAEPGRAGGIRLVGARAHASNAFTATPAVGAEATGDRRCPSGIGLGQSSSTRVIATRRCPRKACEGRRESGPLTRRNLGCARRRKDPFTRAIPPHTTCALAHPPSFAARRTAGPGARWPGSVGRACGSCRWQKSTSGVGSRARAREERAGAARSSPVSHLGGKAGRKDAGSRVRAAKSGDRWRVSVRPWGSKGRRGSWHSSREGASGRSEATSLNETAWKAVLAASGASARARRDKGVRGRLAISCPRREDNARPGKAPPEGSKTIESLQDRTAPASAASAGRGPHRPKLLVRRQTLQEPGESSASAFGASLGRRAIREVLVKVSWLQRSVKTIFPVRTKGRRKARRRRGVA